MAGYSGTPLAKKLGIKPGQRVALLNPPPGFERILRPLPSDVRLVWGGRGVNFDVVHAFARDQKELGKRLPTAMKMMSVDGALWVSWPKLSSGIASDLTEDRIREQALASGLVDVKVCAVDEIWSGLKLVYRTRDRAAARKKTNRR